jgi:hypothetical protein
MDEDTSTSHKKGRSQTQIEENPFYLLPNEVMQCVSKNILIRNQYNSKDLSFSSLMRYNIDFHEISLQTVQELYRRTQRPLEGIVCCQMAVEI